MSRRRPPERTRHSPRGPGGDASLVRIFGIHAVEAVLANPNREVRALYVTRNGERRLEAAIGRRGITPNRVEPRSLERLLGGDSVHQGAMVETAGLAEPALGSLFVRRDGGPVRIVVLDQVSDPHNVGAILRSAAAFGVDGLVMTRRHSPPLSGVLAKSASGGLERVPIVLVANLARALHEIGEAGIRRFGLDGDGHERLERLEVDGALAIVLGAEGRGLRRLSRENCDVLCRIATTGTPSSLNVSNAAAVALHWLANPRPHAEAD